MIYWLYVFGFFCGSLFTMNKKVVDFTLGLIKPNSEHNKKLIKGFIQYHNFYSLYEIRKKLTDQDIFFLYSHIQKKPFFPEMKHYLQSAESDILLLTRFDQKPIVEEFRKLMGHTDPSLADKNTIRGRFGIKYKKEMHKNAIHGSDSKKRAEEEINYFFKELVLRK
jgi:nucleoside-diphosphate kinase